MGVGLCVHLPAVAGDREGGASERRASDAVSLDSAAAAHASAPNTPAATATAEASGTRALRRSKSGGKSSKVRPFLPLHCPSKSLSRHSELLGAPATWHARGGGSLAGLDAGCRRERRPACHPSGLFLVGAGYGLEQCGFAREPFISRCGVPLVGKFWIT